MTSANPLRRDVPPSLHALYLKQQPTNRADECVFLVHSTISGPVVTEAGAPQTIWTEVHVAENTLDFQVLWTDKRATRLTESIFFSFVPSNPTGAKSEGVNTEWKASVLNITQDPTTVFAGPNKYGGSPHLRGVDHVEYCPKDLAGKCVKISSLDVPIVSFGTANPFPTPRTEAPDMNGGVHFNILNNVWNTNYVLWYPFNDRDSSSKFRFRIEL